MERARLMRWLICAVVVLGLAPSAFAEDFGVLRGPEPTYHWGGFYGGVQSGYSTAPINFSQAASPQIGYILRNTAIEADEQISQWSVLGSDYPYSASAGGFVGYNVEWDNVVLGLELNYNRVSLSASSSGALTRNFTDSNNLPAGHSYFYSVSVGSESSLHITDIGTFRARAGWEVGNVLPYAFAGLAVSHANISTGTSVGYTAVDFVESETPPLTPLPNLAVGPTGLANANGALEYGFATGLGVDVALLPNLFVRGEFEYIYFAPTDGIQVSVTSARVGVGVKF
jgi:opacity protein-like surface antigen